jgi:hypothetical protein
MENAILRKDFNLGMTGSFFHVFTNINLLTCNKSSQPQTSSTCQLRPISNLDNLLHVSPKNLSTFVLLCLCIKNFRLLFQTLGAWQLWSSLHFMNIINLYLSNHIGCFHLLQLWNIFPTINCIFCLIKAIPMKPMNHTSCKIFVDLPINHLALPCDPCVQLKNGIHYMSKNFFVIPIPIFRNFKPKYIFDLRRWHVFFYQTQYINPSCC